MTEAASRGRPVAGTIRLAYVVTRWPFIDRFPQAHSDFPQGLALPAIEVPVAASAGSPAPTTAPSATGTSTPRPRSNTHRRGDDRTCIEPLDDDRFLALSHDGKCELQRVEYTPLEPGNRQRYPADWEAGRPAAATRGRTGHGLDAPRRGRGRTSAICA